MKTFQVAMSGIAGAARNGIRGFSANGSCFSQWGNILSLGGHIGDVIGWGITLFRHLSERHGETERYVALAICVKDKTPPPKYGYSYSPTLRNRFRMGQKPFLRPKHKAGGDFPLLPTRCDISTVAMPTSLGAQYMRETYGRLSRSYILLRAGEIRALRYPDVMSGGGNRKYAVKIFARKSKRGGGGR